MATAYRWIGGAPARSQVTTFAVSYTSGVKTYTITCGGVTICTVTGVTDSATTAAAIVTAWNASTQPYAAQITASSNSGTLTLTGDVAGVPFDVSGSAAGAGTGTLGSATTASGSEATGPNSFNDVRNWQDMTTGLCPMTVPGASASDTITIDGGPNITWDNPVDGASIFAQANALESITIYNTYTGRIGTDLRSFVTSSDGVTASNAIQDYNNNTYSGGYTGQRISLIRMRCGDLYIGQRLPGSNQSGPSRVAIQHRVTSTIDVLATAASGVDSGLPLVRIQSALSASGARQYFPTSLYVNNAPGGVQYGSEYIVSAGGAANSPRPDQVIVSGAATRCWLTGLDDDSGSYGLLTVQGATVSIIDNLQAATGWTCTIEASGGTIIAEGSPIHTINAFGGGVTTDTNLITTVNMYGGSTLTLPLQETTQTITTLNMYSDRATVIMPSNVDITNRNQFAGTIRTP